MCLLIPYFIHKKNKAKRQAAEEELAPQPVMAGKSNETSVPYKHGMEIVNPVTAPSWERKQV